MNIYSCGSCLLSASVAMARLKVAQQARTGHFWSLVNWTDPRKSHGSTGHQLNLSHDLTSTQTTHPSSKTRRNSNCNVLLTILPPAPMSAASAYMMTSSWMMNSWVYFLPPCSVCFQLPTIDMPSSQMPPLPANVLTGSTLFQPLAPLRSAPVPATSCARCHTASESPPFFFVSPPHSCHRALGWVILVSQHQHSHHVISLAFLPTPVPLSIF